jgi:hypothetical protein
MLASDIDEDLDDTLAAELEDAAQPEDAGPSARLPRSASAGPAELAWWLARLCVDGVTGRLWTVSEGRERSFFLDAGRIVLASGNGEEDRLGEFLVREGRLAPEARDRALDQARASGRRLGLVLIQLGQLAGSELGPSLRAQQERVVVGALATAGGVLGFDPGLTVDRRRARLLRHPAALVREGLIALASLGGSDGAAALWERIGGSAGVLLPVDGAHAIAVEEAVAGLRADSQGARDAHLADVRRLLALFDGGRPNGLVAAAWGQPEPAFLALAATLRAFGVLIPAASRAAAAAVGGQRDRQLAGERLLARFALGRAGDYFEFLGLPPEAGARDVGRALARVGQELARVAADPEMAATLSAELALVRAVRDEAARVLGDEGLRAAYRAALGADSRPETVPEATD